MITTLATIISKLFSLGIGNPLALTWARRVVVLLFAIAVIVPGVFIYRACTKPPKIDEKQLQKVEQAIKERNDEKLKDVLAESDTRIENLDSGILQAEENTRQARKNYDGMTFDELAAEIERRRNE